MALTTAQAMAVEKMKKPAIAKLKKELHSSMGTKPTIRKVKTDSK